MKKTLALLVASAMVLLTGCAGIDPSVLQVMQSYAPAAAETAVAEEAAPAEEVAETVEEVEVADTVYDFDQNIVILFTNDTHCGVEEGIGFEGLASVRNTIKSLGHSVIIADAGDAVQGDVIGTLTKGEAIINIMNEVGYDVATLGNHEFDYGMDRLMELKDMADFPYVSCNFCDAEGTPLFDPYTIIEVDGVKLAFVGISTPKTITSSNPKNFMNEEGEFIYNFGQDEDGSTLYGYVQAAVDAARADGADFVFGLSHLGIELDCSPWTASELINNTTGIDVVLDGHSHSVLPEEIVKNLNGEDVILTSTGTKFQNIGMITIANDGTLHSQLIFDTNESNNSMSSVISDINAQNEEILNEVVATLPFDMCTVDPATGERMVRTQETNLGDMCADAYKAMSGADVAFVNGGGVRADLPAGDITFGDIIKVHPFGNSMCVCEATGEEIYEALELSAASLPGEYGGFLQVSGISFTIDLSVPSPAQLDENGIFTGLAEGADPRVKDIMIGEEPIDLEKTYTVASHNYMLQDMGDGYSMFADNVYTQESVMIDNQVLINYIVDVLGGSIGEEYSDPYGQGRITIVE